MSPAFISMEAYAVGVARGATHGSHGWFPLDHARSPGRLRSRLRLQMLFCLHCEVCVSANGSFSFTRETHMNRWKEIEFLGGSAEGSLPECRLLGHLRWLTGSSFCLVAQRLHRAASRPWFYCSMFPCKTLLLLLMPLKLPAMRRAWFWQEFHHFVGAWWTNTHTYTCTHTRTHTHSDITRTYGESW